MSTATDAARLWAGLVQRAPVVEALRTRALPVYVGEAARLGLVGCETGAVVADPEGAERVRRALSFLPAEAVPCALAVLERWAVTGDTSDASLPVSFPKGTGEGKDQRLDVARAMAPPLEAWAGEALGRRHEARKRKAAEGDAARFHEGRERQRQAGRETSARRWAARALEHERWCAEARRLEAEHGPLPPGELAAAVVGSLRLGEHVSTVAKALRKARR